jgi:hypothetical protein
MAHQFGDLETGAPAQAQQGGGQPEQCPAIIHRIHLVSCLGTHQNSTAECLDRTHHAAICTWWHPEAWHSHCLVENLTAIEAQQAFMQQNSHSSHELPSFVGAADLSKAFDRLSAD